MGCSLPVRTIHKTSVEKLSVSITNKSWVFKSKWKDHANLHFWYPYFPQREKLSFLSHETSCLPAFNILNSLSILLQESGNLYCTTEGSLKTHFQFPVISNNNMEHEWTCEATEKPAAPTVKYWNGVQEIGVECGSS